MDTYKVEGKSPRTLVIYKTHIDRYLSAIHPETPNASNALGYMASLKDRGYAPATIHQVLQVAPDMVQLAGKVRNTSQESPGPTLKPPRSLTAFIGRSPLNRSSAFYCGAISPGLITPATKP